MSLTIRKTANSNVVNFANADMNADGYGNMHTRNSADMFAVPTGHLPYRLADVLRKRFHAKHVTQVIYSYGTPIAWLDDDLWIIPEIKYSITTSKHQGYLYRLTGKTRRVEWDTPMDEYLRVLEGKMYYASGRTWGTGL